MNLELVSALAFGLLVGMGLGWWRCMVYCRKLRHFAIDLDDWSHYDPAVRQAHGVRESSRPTGRVAGSIPY